MLNRWKKYLLLSEYPPFANFLDSSNFLKVAVRIYYRTLGINKARLLIGDEKIADYLTPLPSVNAIISESEANSLYKAAYFLKGEGDIVEIGTWRGGSALILASGIKDAGQKRFVHGIDPFSEKRDRVSMKYLRRDIKALGLKSLKENYYYVQKLLRTFNLEKNVIIYKTSSSKARKIWKGKIKFLFIDGNHQYKYVKNDFAIWSELVTQKGFVAFHDCKNIDNPKVGLPGPTKVANTLKKKTKSWKYLGQVDSLIFFQKI